MHNFRPKYRIVYDVSWCLYLTSKYKKKKLILTPDKCKTPPYIFPAM